ncbi:MAG: HRDC domain-containing protein [Chloroflexi bacterium]|nr:HRDC domain-containing protein [Chloroflexota bacterium]
MSPGPLQRPELITDAPGLVRVVEALLKEGCIALDTESDGFHRYPEKICLVQLASQDRVYIVDPLAIGDMMPLERLLADRRVEKVIHSAENDLRIVDRHWGYRIFNLYDTSVGAHFLGMERLGLGAIAEEFLGVQLDKSKKLQRADWSLRPLSDTAIDYAAADVAHLVALRDALARRIEALGRAEWVAEEFERIEEVRYIPPEQPELSFLSIKGSSALDGRGLALLQELASFREGVALRQGRPPFRILPNTTLLSIAGDPTVDLSRVPGLGNNNLRRFGAGLKSAIRKGLASPPVKRPPFRLSHQPRPSVAQVRLAKELRSWRTEEGKRLSLDPALIWPAASLDRLARASVTLDQELESPEVRRWQAREFRGSLRAYLSDK